MRARNWVVALAVFCGLGTLAPRASADTVNIQYNISVTSSLPDFGAVLGPPGTGLMTINWQGTTGSNILPSGPVHLISQSVNANLDFTLLADQFTGSAHIALGPSGAGTLLAGAWNIAGAAGTQTGFVHCTGPNCAVYGFPATDNLALTGPLSGVAFAGTVNLPGMGKAGGDTITAAGGFGTLNGFLITFVLTGTEIGRTHIPAPEPSLISLLGLGVLGLAGAAWGARRARG